MEEKTQKREQYEDRDSMEESMKKPTLRYRSQRENTEERAAIRVEEDVRTQKRLDSMK